MTCYRISTRRVMKVTIVTQVKVILIVKNLTISQIMSGKSIRKNLKISQKVRFMIITNLFVNVIRLLKKKKRI